MSDKQPTMRKCNHGVPKFMCDMCKPAPSSFAASVGSARHAALKAACTTGLLDRAILCGLGLSADSANIVMLHIEELRDQIKRMTHQMRPMTDEERRDVDEFLKQHSSPNKSINEN